MRWLCSSAVVIAILAAGCGESTAPGEPTGDEITTSAESSEAPASTTTDQPPPPVTGGGKKQQKPATPGVPGSPIAYDSTTISGGSPKKAKAAIEKELAGNDKCKPNSCGIKVVIKGNGGCIESISPNPVYRNKTITIVAGCADEITDIPDTTTTSSEAMTTTSQK